MSEDNEVQLNFIENEESSNLDSSEVSGNGIPEDRRIDLKSVLDLETALKDAVTNYFNANEGILYSVTMPIALEVMLRFPYHWLVTLFGRTTDEYKLAVNEHLDNVIKSIQSVESKDALSNNIDVNENKEG